MLYFNRISPLLLHIHPFLFSVAYDLKRTYASSAIQTLSDGDPTTCVKLSLARKWPSFKVTFNIDKWISTSVKIYVYHHNMTPQSSKWLSAYANTSGPHPTSLVILRRMCQLVMTSSNVTDITCTCVFPCYITVELSVLRLEELDICELKLVTA